VCRKLGAAVILSAARLYFRCRNLPNELKQTGGFRRPVAVLLGDGRDARGLAAGIDLDPDRLNIAPAAVLQANRKRVATMHNRPAAREKQASPLFGAGHQRLLAFA
jgi:hypothetical protein